MRSRPLYGRVSEFRFLAEHAFEGSELIYSDPPYPRRTRTSKHRCRFDYEEEDHVEQLSCMRADVVQGGA